MGWLKKLIVDDHQCDTPVLRKVGKWRIVEGSRWECPQCEAVWEVEWLASVGFVWSRAWMPEWNKEKPAC